MPFNGTTTVSRYLYECYASREDQVIYPLKDRSHRIVRRPSSNEVISIMRLIMSWGGDGDRGIYYIMTVVVVDQLYY